MRRSRGPHARVLGRGRGPARAGAGRSRASRCSSGARSGRGGGRRRRGDGSAERPRGPRGRPRARRVLPIKVLPALAPPEQLQLLLGGLLSACPEASRDAVDHRAALAQGTAVERVSREQGKRGDSRGRRGSGRGSGGGGCGRCRRRRAGSGSGPGSSRAAVAPAGRRGGDGDHPAPALRRVLLSSKRRRRRGGGERGRGQLSAHCSRCHCRSRRCFRRRRRRRRSRGGSKGATAAPRGTTSPSSSSTSANEPAGERRPGLRRGQRARRFAPKGRRRRRRAGAGPANPSCASASASSAPSTSDRGPLPAASPTRQGTEAHNHQEASDGHRGPVRGLPVDLGVDPEEASREIPQDRDDVAPPPRSCQQPHLDGVLHPQGGLDDGVLGHALGFDAKRPERRARGDRGVVGEVPSDVEPSQSVVPRGGGGLGRFPSCDARGLARDARGDVGHGRGDVCSLVEGLDDDGVRRRRRRRWRGAGAAEDASRGGEGRRGRGEGEDAQRRGQDRREERALASSRRCPARRRQEGRGRGRGLQVEVVAEG